MYSLVDVPPSTDSLRAAQAIFKKHSNDSLINTIKITVSQENLSTDNKSAQKKNKNNAAILAATIATNDVSYTVNPLHKVKSPNSIPYRTTSNSSSVSSLSISSPRNKRLASPSTPEVAAAAAVQNTSHNDSRIELDQLDNSFQNMNIVNIPNRYRYKSKLDQVKSKLHHHHHHHNSKKDMKLDCNLILLKRANKLRKTLRRDDTDNEEADILSNSEDDEDKENLISLNSKHIHNGIDILSRSNSFTSESERYYYNLQNEESHRYKKVLKQKYKKSAERIKQKINLSPTAQYEKKQKKKDQFNEDKPWKAHRDVNFINIEERRRYEAMWMSNRFRYLTTLHWWPPTTETITDIPHILPQDGLILALVVYKIWKRSNLSNSLLANIFDLVDFRKDGTLDRRSFIVGMWLVDQCLYGRKLPQVVPQEVWESVDRFAVNVAMNDKINMKTKKKIFKRQVKLIKNTKS